MDMAEERDITTGPRPDRRTGLLSRWRLGSDLGSNITLTLMALPALAYVFLFSYVTMPYILIAFKRYRNVDGLWGSPWVGFKNFQFLFGVSDKGWQITRNILAYNIVGMVLGLIVSVTLAILISEVYKSFAAKFYRTSLLFPHFFSWVVVGYIAFAFFDHDTGMLNGLLERVGLSPVAWYHEPQYWPFILILTSLWKGLGMSTILYLSGILRINPEYYEVAAMDGATKFQQAIYITIPLLVPLMTVVNLLALGRILNADFGLFYQVPRQYLNAKLIPVTDVIDTFVYRALQQNAQIEMSAAAGLYRSAIGFVLVVITNAIVRKVAPERALF